MKNREEDNRDSIVLLCLCFVLFCFLSGKESTSFHTHSEDLFLSCIWIHFGDMHMACRKLKKSYFMIPKFGLT